MGSQELVESVRWQVVSEGGGVSICDELIKVIVEVMVSIGAKRISGSKGG